MCGLLGSVNSPFDHRVLDLISRRGPDSSGLAEYKAGSHRVTFGHRRLSIIDLSSAGSQPMESLCGRYGIIYNGEIYNHEALRKSQDAVSYRGHSDTETILNRIAQRGIRTVDDFNGIFAFALLDHNKKKLFLCRDRFGVKPLYYYQKDNKFIFGSEIKPLLAQVRDSVDEEHIAEVLRLRYSPSPNTLFRNIRKVRPGHIVEIDLDHDQLRIREYPYIGKCPDQVKITYEEAVETYGELFASSVESQLMSDVEVGILLSGGIDSALVAFHAQHSSNSRLKAFTVGFGGGSYADETQDAAETASCIGLEHYSARIDFNDFLGMMRKCVRIVEEPLATTSIIPMYYLSSLAADHVKVVLSGQGADESLGGYGRYQGELYQSFVPSGFARLAAALANAAGIRKEKILRGLHALGESDEVRRFVRTYDVFNRQEVTKLTGGEKEDVEVPIRYFLEVLGCEKQETSVERMMSIDLRMNLSDDLLLYTDKISMHHSLECRVPLLDLELVRFIESLPRDFRLKLGRSKLVHKAYARNVLPSVIVNREKKGFMSPTRQWFGQVGILREILLDTNAKLASYFDIKVVSEIINQHERGYNRERQIFLLLALFYWFEEFA